MRGDHDPSGLLHLSPELAEIQDPRRQLLQAVDQEMSARGIDLHPLQDGKAMPIGQLLERLGLPEAVVLGETDPLQPPVPGRPDRLIRIQDVQRDRGAV